MATGKKAAGKAVEVVEEVIKVEKAPVMYVGPTIHQIGVINNITYTEIPETVAKAIERIPAIKALFIPVDEFPEAEKSIREESGYYWSAYKATVKYLDTLKRR